MSARAERAEAERNAERERAERYRAALTEIISPPDANGPHENYGCLDLDEARQIATCALGDEDSFENMMREPGR